MMYDLWCHNMASGDRKCNNSIGEHVLKYVDFVLPMASTDCHSVYWLEIVSCIIPNSLGVCFSTTILRHIYDMHLKYNWVLCMPQWGKITFYSWGPLYKNVLTSVLAWISNYIYYNMCDEITYPFPNFKRWNHWSLAIDKRFDTTLG